MVTDTQKFTNRNEYKIEHGRIYKYIVYYRDSPDPLNGIYSVDNPWKICHMTDNYDRAMAFIHEQKNKKIGVIL